MKRLIGLFSAAIIISSLAIAPAFAQMKGGGMPMGDITERHQMMQDVMGMMKETMMILKDLNHTPTAEQKGKLDEMIKRMDGFMKKHEEMMKHKEEKMEKKGEY